MTKFHHNSQPYSISLRQITGCSLSHHPKGMIRGVALRKSRIRSLWPMGRMLPFLSGSALYRLDWLNDVPSAGPICVNDLLLSISHLCLVCWPTWRRRQLDEYSSLVRGSGESLPIGIPGQKFRMVSHVSSCE